METLPSKDVESSRNVKSPEHIGARKNAVFGTMAQVVESGKARESWENVESAELSRPKWKKKVMGPEDFIREDRDATCSSGEVCLSLVSCPGRYLDRQVGSREGLSMG